MRIGRAWGWGIALSYAAAIVWLGPGSRTGFVDGLLTRGVGALSWFALGLVSLSSANLLAQSAAAAPLIALGRQRGHRPRVLQRLRTLAVAWRMGCAVALPMVLLALSAVAMASSLAEAAHSLLLALLVAAYALGLVSAMALLARLSAQLSPGRPRTLLAALVLVPHLAREVVAAVPSIPAFFAWWLESLPRIGGLVA